MLELRRSDIGFGRVRISDHSVERTTLFGRHALTWDEIRDYRLTIELTRRLSNELASTVHLHEVIEGYRGRHGLKLGIELIGDDDTVAFNWRFRDVALAIAQVVQRIRERFLASAQSTLVSTGAVTFGPLELSATSVRWNVDELAADKVEAIELFNSSPVSLRVMARGRVWPHGSVPTAKVPNLLAVLEALGYVVRGRELLGVLLIAAPAAP
ncbi:MAG: hypothetical protein JWP01_570 [Myxococcales bacterium]|nr:hypothetical protein [Myxococcales bacterium]